MEKIPEPVRGKEGLLSLSLSLSVSPRSVIEIQTISMVMVKHFFHLNNTTADFKGTGHFGQPLSMRDAQKALQKCRHFPELFLTDTKPVCAASQQTPLPSFLGEANTPACPNVSSPEHPPNLLIAMKPADIPLNP